MPHRRKLHLVLLWHMHQPDYRRYSDGEFVLPWVYLHAIKDYTDMAYHLETHPGVRAVVNFVPVLLDQIEDYARQFAEGRLRDPLLDLLGRESLEGISTAEREMALQACFRGNHQNMVDPYPAYQRLREVYRAAEGHGAPSHAYLSGQYMADLLTWYHLAWTGESVRRSDPLVARLMTRGHGFTADDRRALRDLIGRLVSGVVPRWRRLAERGQVELSATPHHHPLAPLLLDLGCARQAIPDAPLPEAACYPGGRESVLRQIEWAVESHARRFGAPPAGMWPAEGALSDGTLALLGGQSLAWSASGEGVLANSLRRAAGGKALPPRSQWLYRPYRTAAAPETLCFFRDDHLSDLIGFEFAKWHGRDAAHHLVEQLERIAREAPEGEEPVVSIILDGENAWEYYPYNGWYFFTELYGALQGHHQIVTSVYSELAEAYRQPPAKGPRPAAPGELGQVVAGSWVYGNLSTWIGSPDKNRAWDLLAEAKACFDRVMAQDRLDAHARAAAVRQLASCESSDWFWWFGDYNPAHSVATFDALFRDSLAHLYRLLGEPIPAGIRKPISRGGGSPETGGTMRRGSI